MRNKTLYVGSVLGISTITYLLVKNYLYQFKKLPVVENFDINRYMGKWHEIARLDYFFEKNLTDTTAHYSFNEDDTIKVVNQGYDIKSKKWKSVTGKAKFAKYEGLGSLKVSFFGPVYADYHIISVDENYQYALVFGKNNDYVWFLSRTTEIPSKIIKKYLKIAKKFGYNVEKLQWISHD